MGFKTTFFQKCFTAKGDNSSLLEPGTRYQLLATIIVNILTFAHGFGTGWLSPILTKIQAPDSPLDFEVTVSEISWLGSMLGLGAMCGNIVCALLLNRAGRKFCIYFNAIPYACFWILVYYAKSIEYLYVGRFLCGFTGGSGYVVVPIFISEIADSNIRGALASMVLLAMNSGVLVGFILGTHLDFYLIPFLGLLLPITYFIANLFLPETTQHLMRRGKLHDAQNSFIFYRNLKHEDSTKYKADFEELRIIITANQTSPTAQLNYRDLFTKSSLKAFAIAMVLSAGFQFSGVFCFVNYTSEIFARSGSLLDPNTSTIIIGVAQIVGVYTSTLFVDIWGRRILMLMSTSGIVVGCTAFGFFAYFGSIYELTAYNWAPLLLMTFIIYAANIGLVGLFFIVLVEAFPLKVRSVGTSISLVIVSGFTFCTLKVFPLLLHNYDLSITMWFSATVSLLTFLYFYFFLQETKGKSMDQD